ncbi:hypothetical protein SH528x_003409 [Novipirellula sp. SH528]|uniref:hypothetical protein n=1 Tax=Novipirellula sp. SH528 TaxID=3454466 RepID=UPI003FA0B144
MIRRYTPHFCVVIVAMIGCSAPLPQIDLPTVDSIASATATLNGDFLGHTDVAEFTLTRNAITAILRALSPARQRNADRTASPIGVISIRLHNGQTHVIRFYDFGQNPIGFDFDGIPCARNGDYERKNMLTDDETAFFPNEGINLYNYLRSQNEGEP